MGLLVRSWGKVTQLGSDYFYIDDGSRLWDGSGYRGVRVDISPVPTWVAEDQYVRVTGIQGLRALAGEFVRALKPRSEDEISQLTEWPTYEVALHPGENRVGLPAIPSPPDPESVFAACPGKPTVDISGNLTRVDSETGFFITYVWCESELFGDCLLGDGFKLSVDSETSMCYTGAAATGDQWISLPGQRFVANPFDHDVAWSNCRFSDGVSLKNPFEAVAAGWLSEIVYYWNAETQTLVQMDITAWGSTLVRGLGYAVPTSKADLALIVPAQAP